MSKLTRTQQSRRRRIALAAVVAAGLGLLTACQPADVTQRGEVANPTIAIQRDGAASTVLGGKVFWAFGDTFAPGGGVRSSAAYADPATPTQVIDTLVERRPLQLVPFTDTEAADNASGLGSQWVIWPTEVINTSADRALIFSTKFHATPDGWVEPSLVISEIAAGSTQSRRIAEPIRNPKGNFAAAVYERNGMVYLHDCGGANLAPELATKVGSTLPGLGLGDLTLNPTPGKCRLARVPLSKAADATAYRYWTGTTWATTASSATGVVPGSNSGLSVAWSPKLGKYVALSSPGLAKTIQMSTAPRPEGPWTKPTTVFTAETGIYAIRIHRHLSSPDLATMGVTYFRQDQPSKQGGVVLIDLTPAAS
ncbi:MAG: hypothetical protein JWO77_3339 [Ilumatobacteraceae bacterium]|nr:hypothetical protein [Ilumatobacteraceae bacterium]